MRMPAVVCFTLAVWLSACGTDFGPGVEGAHNETLTLSQSNSEETDSADDADLTGIYYDFGLPSGQTSELAGVTFVSPEPFGDANVSSVGPSTSIANTNWPDLYRREVWADGPLRYDIPTDNGSYTVHLHFAEYANANPGAMVLDAFVNEEEVATGVGLNAGGFQTAVVRSADVEVAGGVLSVEVRPAEGTQYSKISGLEIVPLGAPSRLTLSQPEQPPEPGDPGDLLEGLSGPTAAEVEVYRERAQGRTSTPFADVGDTLPNSPGDWSRIEAAAQDFQVSMQSFGEPYRDQHGNLRTADYENFWNGPIAGRRTAGQEDPRFWNGQGVIPTWAKSKYKRTDNGNYVPCAEGTPEKQYKDGDAYWICQDAAGISDDLFDASFYALVMDDTSLRDGVRRALLRQTDVSKAPGVDFTNRSRWPVQKDDDVIVSTNPFFFTALWITKIARTYEYSRMAVIDGEVRESGVYSAAEAEQIETWLRNAGEYYREITEYGLINDYGFFENVEDRIAGRHRSSALNRAPGTWANSYRYWDDGPQPTIGQLRYQNRITASAMAFCVIGFTVEDQLMQRDCKLFFQEVIRYGVDANGYLGDFYRDQLNGEKGLDYVSGQASHLVEMADAFARAGDSSLYEYTTSDGAGTPGGHTTTGGPKSLYQVLIATGRFYQVGGNQNRKKGGNLIDADSGGNGRRYVQIAANFAAANVYYRDPALRDLVYLSTSAGYRGFQSPNSVQITGYVIHPTRATFGGSVGHLFLYGGLEKAENSVWPYPGIPARAPLD
ncbi:MAG: malectin domain-containing carbohydrate-binding protein [Myxococcota bacterium]